MGAWGTNSFENDGAMDLVLELEHSENPQQLLEATLSEPTDEAELATRAIAACEVFAAAGGSPAEGLPDEVIELLESGNVRVPLEIISSAIAVLQRIRSEGELYELWAETEDVEAWLASVDALIGRLQEAKSAANARNS